MFLYRTADTFESAFKFAATHLLMCWETICDSADPQRRQVSVQAEVEFSIKMVVPNGSIISVASTKQS